MSSETVTRPASATTTAQSRRLSGGIVVSLMTVSLIAGFLYLGQRTGWKLLRASAVGQGSAKESGDDWCADHVVPESICVECGGAKPKSFGWCRKHGVSNCPHCNPAAAELSATPTVTEGDLKLVKEALDSSPRVENNRKCKIPERRLQLVNATALKKLGISVEPARRGRAAEWITAPAELTHDPTRVARVSARAEGAIVDVSVAVGDLVMAGDILAVVDSGEIGQAKSEFRQALVDEELKTKTLIGLRGSEGGIAGARIREVESSLEDAKLRVLTARQVLANLGLPIQDLRGATGPDLTQRLQSLGLPTHLTSNRSYGRSSSLIVVRSPIDGEVTSLSAVKGETTEANKPLFVVADASRLWISLSVRLEDAVRVRAGMPVLFQHEGGEGVESAKVNWISPIADERTRGVTVRAELVNQKRVHRAGTFGTGRVVLRDEAKALLVPSEAVHWEGDCHVVFVQDRNFDKDDSPKVFHVRQIRPGATDVAMGAPVTEVAAGLLPGEFVAVANSGLFRSELLKNNLGAG